MIATRTLNRAHTSGGTLAYAPRPAFTPSVSLTAPSGASVSTSAPLAAKKRTSARPASAGSRKRPATVNPIIFFTLASGQSIGIPLAEARRVGMVATDAKGRVSLTRLGSSMLQTLAQSQAPSGQAAAGTNQAGAASGEAGAQQAADGAAKADEPITATRMLEIAMTQSMFGAQMLSVLKRPGLPKWRSAWSLTKYFDKLSGEKLLPNWVKTSPVKDVMTFAVVGDYMYNSIKDLPGAKSTFRGVMDAEKAAGRGGLKSVVKAAFTEVPKVGKEAEAAASAVADAAKGAKAAQPTIEKLFKLIGPLAKVAYTSFALSSFIGLHKYVKENGAQGFLNTRSGRSAISNATQGALMLGVIFLKDTPAMRIASLTADVIWLFDEFNQRGWLDGTLGGDPPEKANGQLAQSATSSGGTTQPSAKSSVLAL